MCSEDYLSHNEGIGVGTSLFKSSEIHAAHASSMVYLDMLWSLISQEAFETTFCFLVFHENKESKKAQKIMWEIFQCDINFLDLRHYIQNQYARWS